MFDWLQKLGGSTQGLADIQRQFLQMLQDGRHIFDAAANALVGGTTPDAIRNDLYETDLRINQTEMAVRRGLVVHGTVHGASTFPALLVLMSLVKDAERIGDYSKNLFEIACAGVSLGDAEAVQSLVQMKDKISKFLVRAQNCFESKSVEDSGRLLKEIEAFQKMCDVHVGELLRAQGRNEAPRVLTIRYFKRVVSHIGNVVSSVVMPLDKLDFYPDKPMSEQ
ncbi:MAG: PhoU domain-containing protein [Planctomycetes bacterium]|nr:PhoU domain-containing protein [Planctomycetota bacterium]MCB9910472.1 PhoU domain-containing protein [Planctomycetota bacterium]MCB9912598.1 PhoU domain-containing protein [Planctomycetota bacterium]HPF13660.1 PhoU domain-containing protein [Planctomycetota bacterium]HRV80937.1 PhoU domain-containing protein [Planctomycetota bacterium]